MNLPPVHLLQMFTLIVDSASFAKASEQLNLTQSALTMQLKNLQNYFELPLLELRGKRKIPTAFGRLIYQESMNLLQKYQETFKEIHKTYSDSSHQLLKIGGRKELLDFASNCLSFPGCIELLSMSSNQALEALNQQKIDIALLREKPDSIEYVAKEFLENSSHILVHQKYLLKNKYTDSQSDFFKKTPCIAYSHSNEYMNLYLNYYEVKKQDLKIKFVCEDWTIIRNLVEAGLGYAVVPNSITTTATDVKSIADSNLKQAYIKYYFVFKKNFKKNQFYNKLFLK